MFREIYNLKKKNLVIFGSSLIASVTHARIIVAKLCIVVEVPCLFVVQLALGHGITH